MTIGSDKFVVAKAPVSRRVRLRIWASRSARWLHLYLSMVSFGIILFFAVTGLTLNHPDWFSSAVRTRQISARLDAKLVGGQPDTAAIVSAVRAQQHVHGVVDDVRVDDTGVAFTFKAPGYSADVTVNRQVGTAGPAGTYTLTEVSNGTVAILNDLHKGHDAGKAWGWLIDASAVLLSLVSLTGLCILWFLYKRRTSGLVVVGIGIAVCLLVYRIYVP